MTFTFFVANKNVWSIIIPFAEKWEISWKCQSGIDVHVLGDISSLVTRLCNLLLFIFLEFQNFFFKFMVCNVQDFVVTNVSLRLWGVTTEEEKFKKRVSREDREGKAVVRNTTFQSRNFENKNFEKNIEQYENRVRFGEKIFNENYTVKKSRKDWKKIRCRKAEIWQKKTLRRVLDHKKSKKRWIKRWRSNPEQ